MAKEKLVRAGEVKAKLIDIRNWFGGPVQTEQDKLAQAVVNMCIEEIDKMEPAQKWIPVTERLPTKEDATEQGAVLAWEVSVKHWDIWAWDCVRDYADRFVGWMPLPEPPKGEAK